MAHIPTSRPYADGPHAHNHRTNFDYNVIPYGFRGETFLVVTPHVGHREPSTGHWRTSRPGPRKTGHVKRVGTERLAVKPRTDPRPTGGAVNGSTCDPGIGPATTPKRRGVKTVRVHPSTTELHAAWSRGVNII